MSQERITVALDAMGGDHGVTAAVHGAARLSLEDTDIVVLCVGDTEAMSRALDQVSYDPTRLVLVRADGFVPMDAKPREALAQAPNCSVLTAARLVADGHAKAMVSAGNTGATVLAAVSTFNTIPGIKRAALASVYPTARRRGPRNDPFALMLDVGATLSADADALVGFAVMGAAYSAIISEIPHPTVGLLSNGNEPSKGTPAIVEAHKRLASSSLRFHGNVEGLDIPQGSVDVIVCDGFLGNVVLKMLEGMGDVLMNMASDAAKRKVQWRIGLSMLESGLDEIKRLTDWKMYGGAPLLGLDHLAIKAHGRSEAGAIRNAIKVAAKAVRGRLNERIIASLGEHGLGS